MSYKNEIERLGGLRIIYPTAITTLNNDEINRLEEEFGNRLPDELSEFLLVNGIVDFNKEALFEPISVDAEYIHDSQSNQPDFFFEGSSFGVFYGRDPEKDGAYDIFWNIKNYKDRMPSNFLPFANDGMGNQIVVSLKQENYGNIYFWDHEAEWDADDYFEETGNVMPEGVKYQNLWLLATDFNGFFERLHTE